MADVPFDLSWGETHRGQEEAQRVSLVYLLSCRCPSLPVHPQRAMMGRSLAGLTVLWTFPWGLPLNAGQGNSPAVLTAAWGCMKETRCGGERRLWPSSPDYSDPSLALL